MNLSGARKKRGRSIDTISERRKARLQQVIDRRQPDLTIVVENVWDPHNVSAILRSADAVGIRTVHLLYHVETAPNFKAIGKKSSASAKKWLDLRLHHNVADCFTALREEGFRIYASHLTKESVPLYSLDATGKVCFVLGNEHRGVSDEVCALCDGIYYIPMLGMVESLNVSVAAAVTLYEALRQRSAAGLYDVPQMPQQARSELLAEWARI
jgi:tRNA (guanosine-2'-O-)-methyltransferase